MSPKHDVSKEFTAPHFVEEKVEARLSVQGPDVLRLHFTRPLRLHLGDREQQQVVSERIWRFIDFRLEEGTIETLQMLAARHPLAVFTGADLDETEASLNSLIVLRGKDHLVQNYRLIPPIYFFRQAMLTVTAEDLAKNGPIKPFNLRIEVSRILDAQGNLSSSLMAMHEPYIHMYMFPDPVVQYFLELTAEIDELRDSHYARMLRNRKEKGKVIAFPLSEECRARLRKKRTAQENS